MSIRVAVRHRTEYLSDRGVALAPHLIRLRPARQARTSIHHHSPKVEPQQHSLNGQQDPFGNLVACLVFPEKTHRMVIDVGLVVEMVTINPFDFSVEKRAEDNPFAYPKQPQNELQPCFEFAESGPRLTGCLPEVTREPTEIVSFLVERHRRVQREITYIVRMQPGVQTCEGTLEQARGSCRDSAWLLVQILRHLGLAARFVSGYLLQLAPGQASLEGPSGPAEDFIDLHAWVEVFVPGAGWIGPDPTSGLSSGEGHIPLALAPDYVSAAAVTGAVDPCEVEFRFPRYGSIIVADTEMDLRFAIEPWHVPGEEVTAQGTARFVDSSVERLQVKVRGMADARHVVTCNGRRVPLRCTGERGDCVAGVRYKARNPPSGLHPTVPVHAPLVFDIVDTWSGRPLGGCTYYVSHPGGRDDQTLPVNAYEAESRRLARFWQVGHSTSTVQVPDEVPSCEHPYTLDLRFSSPEQNA